MARSTHPFIDCSDVTRIFERINNTVERSPIVFEKTLKDLHSRAPAQVSKAVVSVYGIKKGEISCKKGEVKANAGNIRTFGDDIASFELKYSGRVLTPTHFGMTPKARPEKKKYKVKAKIKKTAKAFNPPSEGGVFLAPAGSAGTTEIPWVRKSKNKFDIQPIKTLSLPQMVDNPNVREVIGENLGELLQKRFDHHLEQHLRRNLR